MKRVLSIQIAPQHFFFFFFSKVTVLLAVLSVTATVTVVGWLVRRNIQLWRKYELNKKCHFYHEQNFVPGL